MELLLFATAGSVDDLQNSHDDDPASDPAGLDGFWGPRTGVEGNAGKWA